MILLPEEREKKIDLSISGEKMVVLRIGYFSVERRGKTRNSTRWKRRTGET